MRPFSRRTLLLFSPYSSSPFSSLPSVQISHFSASPIKLHDEQSKNVCVSVWWDFENCGVPAGVNVFKLAHNISAAVRNNGIKGSIQITAYGDMMQLSRANQEALSATGINLAHIPRGIKSADISLLVDLMYWVSQNPPPAHLFLISCDKDFANILHRLRMRNYNILLASRTPSPILCSAATITWQWEALVRGQDLVGKRFNRPPDGPYGSWYGNFKAPIEDPFSLIGQPICSPQVESVDSGSDSQIDHVPKTVLKKISKILESYPDGICIEDFRSELEKAHVSLGKNFYGQKKFSRFLLSIPHILNVEDLGNGKFMIRGITGTRDNGDCDVTTSSPFGSDMSVSQPFDQMGEDQNAETGEVSVVDESITYVVDREKLFSSPEVKPEKTSPEEQLSLKEVQESSQSAKKVVEIVDEPVIDNLSNPSLGIGVLEKIERLWFGDETASKEKSNEECSSGVTFEKTKDGEICMESRNPDMVKDHPAPSSIDNVSASDNIPDTSPEPCSDESNVKPGLFERIVKWCRAWRSDHKSEILSEQACTVENELFIKDSFWSDMEAFLDTPKGSIIVNQSMTREEFAQNLQREGPADLSSVSEQDLLRLVDMLITEKKWVQESSSQKPPFKLLRAVENTTSVGPQNNNSNKLSTSFKTYHFSDKTSQSDSRSEKPISPADSGKQQPSVRSKSKILSDCQKLVDSILKSHPEGYYIGSFRKTFLGRYGYSFDLQQLGFDKVASLLGSLPGVKVESLYIFPLSSVQEDKPSKKYVSGLSQWDELGPILSSRESEKLGLKIRAKVPTGKRRNFEYEPPVSDDDSDSEKVGSPRSGTKLNSRKLGKTYSFVADSAGSNTKSHLIDNILTNLKTTGETKMSS